MRAVDTNSIHEGQKLAKTIYDDTGRVLLHKGTPLKDYYIERLDKMGISVVYIEDELLGPLEAEDILHDTVRVQAVGMIKNTIEKARITKEIDVRAVSDVVNKIIEDIASSDLLVNFVSFRSEKMHEFNHSVSVAVYSILTGTVMQLDQFKIKQLGMGAILHDIGKAIADEAEHCNMGFELIRQNKEINIAIAHCAYQHHEHYDGNGYPRNLKKDEIHPLAAIVAVANFYDNLVSPLDPVQRYHPYQAVERITAESNHMFDPQIVQYFIRNIAPYPVGSLVRLNSGHLGVVVGLHRNMPTRPIIKTVTDKHGGLTKNFQEVDLFQERTIFINEILSEKDRKELGI